MRAGAKIQTAARIGNFRQQCEYTSERRPAHPRRPARCGVQCAYKSVLSRAPWHNVKLWLVRFLAPPGSRNVVDRGTPIACQVPQLAVIASQHHSFTTQSPLRVTASFRTRTAALMMVRWEGLGGTVDEDGEARAGGEGAVGRVEQPAQHGSQQRRHHPCPRGVLRHAVFCFRRGGEE